MIIDKRRALFIVLIYFLLIFFTPSNVFAVVDISQGDLFETAQNIGKQLPQIDPRIINQFGGNLTVDLYFNDDSNQKVDLGNLIISVPPNSIDTNATKLNLKITPEFIGTEYEKNLPVDKSFVSNLLVDFVLEPIDGDRANLNKDVSVNFSLSDKVIDIAETLDISSIRVLNYQDDSKTWLPLELIENVVFLDNELSLKIKTKDLGKFSFAGDKILLPGMIENDTSMILDTETDNLEPLPTIKEKTIQAINDLANTSVNTSIDNDSTEARAEKIIDQIGQKYKISDPDICFKSAYELKCLEAAQEVIPQLKSLPEDSKKVNDIITAIEGYILYEQSKNLFSGKPKGIGEIVGVLKDAVPTLISNAAKNVAKNTEKFVKSPQGKVTLAVAEPLGIVSGGVLVGSQLVLSSATVTSFSDVYLLLIKALGFMSGLFRRKKRYWGTAYDSVTKRPLDPAYVVAKTGTNEVADALTDLDGRYGFLLPSGVYRLEAQKTNYVFPSKIMAEQGSDILYDNVYHGENVEIKEGEVLVKNIPLDPTTFDWNEFQKEKQNLFRLYSSREKTWSAIFNTAYLLGLLAVILGLVFDPKITNFIFLGVYLCFIIYQIFWLPSKKAVTLKNKNGEPIPFAIIKLFTPDINKQVKSVVTDKMGRFYFLIGVGKYYLTVDEKQSDGSYKNIYTSPVIDLKKGVISEDLVI